MDLFGWLTGASPWWWVALGVALGAAEMLTFSYVLLWPALGAFGVALALWLLPGMGGGAQIAIFAGFSVVSAFAGRAWLRRRGDGEPVTSLNRRSEQMAGRAARAMADFENGEGAVEVDGVRWPARLASGEAKVGAALVVERAADGVLIVRPR